MNKQQLICIVCQTCRLHCVNIDQELNEKLTSSAFRSSILKYCKHTYKQTHRLTSDRHKISCITDTVYKISQYSKYTHPLTFCIQVRICCDSNTIHSPTGKLFWGAPQLHNTANHFPKSRHMPIPATAQECITGQMPRHRHDVKYDYTHTHTHTTV